MASNNNTTTTTIYRGYDFDGTLTTGIQPILPYVIISGRTFAEYNAAIIPWAEKAPIYIRGAGKYGDWQHAGEFKAQMIKTLGITEFYEDDTNQIQIIRQKCPECKIFQVFADKSTKVV
jgi:hypothetical protein